MNEEKKLQHRKSLIKQMFDEMKDKGYNSTHKKDVISFLQFNNEGREIYGVGIGLSIALCILGIKFLGTYGAGFIILGVVLMIISLKGIFKIRTQETKLVELLK